MPHVVLVIPSTSYRGPDFIAAAERLGVTLTVASDAPPPVTAVVTSVLRVDPSRPEAAAAHIEAFARRVPVDAVMGTDDGSIEPAALAAEALGLPANHPSAVAATRDKALMRELLAAAAIPQPSYRSAGGGIAAAADEVGYPVVVKPTGLSGSRGVIRADDTAGVIEAERRIRAILSDAGEDPGGSLLVEEYLPGDELAVEGLLQPTRLEVLACFDKPDPLTGPFFEETIYVTPSRRDPATLAVVGDTVERACRALGLSFGPVHAEVRVDGHSVRVIEVAARSIGGLCSRSLKFGLLGVPLEEILLRSALGMPRRGLHRDTRASGVMMLPIPRAGVLRGVRRRETVSEVPGITGLEVTIPPGRRVQPLPEGDRYLGFLFAEGDRPEEVEAALREAYAGLDVVIDPV